MQRSSIITVPDSLRTADAFPVAIFRRERSDDRKCVCCSQAKYQKMQKIYFQSQKSLRKLTWPSSLLVSKGVI